MALDHDTRRQRLTNEKINKITEQGRKRIKDRTRREAILKKQELKV
jgi:hypothetical protein